MLRVLAGIACLMLAFGGVARADYLNITHGTPNYGRFGAGIFSNELLQSVGTGVFDPFWRGNVPPDSQRTLSPPNQVTRSSQDDNWYELFNSNHRPLDDALEPANMANAADIRLRTFPVYTLQPVSIEAGGPTYFVFILDTNEPKSEAAQELSMDMFRLYTNASDQVHNWSTLTTGSNLIYNIDTAGDCVPLVGASCDDDLENFNNAPYDENTGTGVLLTEKFHAGSGVANLIVYVPTAAFAGHESEYVYLDAMLGGLPTGAEDGFEEWSALRGATFIPEPASILGLGTVLLLVGSRLRRKRS